MEFGNALARVRSTRLDEFVFWHKNLFSCDDPSELASETSSASDDLEFGSSSIFDL